MKHHRWLKLREAILQAEPHAGKALLHRLPCTALQAWLAHHAWHSAREHFHGEELAADGEYEAHQAWTVAQEETARVYEAVAEEFWHMRATCACLAHRVAQEYRLIYTVLTGAPLPDDPEEA